MPYYFGKIEQTVFVATDEADAARIVTQAQPGQRIVIVEADEQIYPLPEGFHPKDGELIFRLPAGFRPLEHSIGNLVIGIKEPRGPDKSVQALSSAHLA